MGIRPEIVIAWTKNAVNAKRLFRCTFCDAVWEHILDSTRLQRGGDLYNLADKLQGPLDEKKRYKFPLHGNTTLSLVNL